MLIMGQVVELERFEYSQIHMGVRVDVKLYASDRALGDKAATAAYARFAELEQIMSDYRPDSEVMRLCAAEAGVPHAISKDLAAVLTLAQALARKTNGAFDVTCGPFVQLWRAARKSGKLPPPSDIARAKDVVGWNLLDVADSTATLAKSGMRIDLGGIAKGYACDAAIEAIRSAGVRRALVEAGGDIATSGSPPGKPGWSVEVLGLPGRRFWLENLAMSTSGDAAQFVVVDGKRYSHVLDPRTGVGLTTRIQASVVGPKATLTDPLATALCVLGDEEGSRIAKDEGVEAIFVTAR